MSGYQRPAASPGGSTGGTTGAVATALAVLAVLAVVTAGVVAAVVGTGGSSSADDPAPPTTSDTGSPAPEESDEPATFFPDGQVIVGDRRDNADVEVPSADEGWELLGTRDTRGFQAGTPDGETLTVAVTGPAVWDVIQCRDDYGYRVDTPRAFGGFTAPTVDEGGEGGGDGGGADRALRSASELVVEQWRDVLVAADELDVGEPSYSDTTISDGTTARLGTFRAVSTSEEEGPCFEADEVNILTFDTGEYFANVVVVRTVGDDGSDLRDGLSADAVQQILASPRLQVTP